MGEDSWPVRRAREASWEAGTWPGETVWVAVYQIFIASLSCCGQTVLPLPHR